MYYITYNYYDRNYYNVLYNTVLHVGIIKMAAILLDVCIQEVYLEPQVLLELSGVMRNVTSYMCREVQWEQLTVSLEMFVFFSFFYFSARHQLLNS